MNILSLFDGMSCGQIAINRIGITNYNYYASEINKYAIQITQKNYPNTIQLGDITKIKSENLPKIDLLIGGSPCQGFSFAGKQLNFDDLRSKLLFEYIRLLKETKPKYYLLENVKMKKEYKDRISNLIGIEPIEIDSALVSAQKRKRLYWTNIPNVTQPKDKNIILQDILENNINKNYIVIPKREVIKINNNTRGKFGYIGKNSQGNKIYFANSKSATLMAIGGGLGGKTGLYFVNNQIRKLTPQECERLQTVPENYTDGVSDTQRYKMLGNGWTVDVIAHILSFMEGAK